jgi:NhaA family Na+:H+ antiporter
MMVSKTIKRENDITVRIIRPFKIFVKTEQASAIILFFCTISALLLANSPIGEDFLAFWQINVTFQFGDIGLSKGVYLWINDGLMAIFFFVIGLEIKREVLVGELNSIRKASLPILAAVGGLLIPASIYIFFNITSPATISGWGIPVATDIAFTLGVLALIGKKAPFSLKVFVTSLAIVDDIGAILIIALFYSNSIQIEYLLIIGIIIAVLILLNRLDMQNPLLYILIGILLWFTILQSGIHATIAGVILAFTIPFRSKIDAERFVIETNILINEFQSEGECQNGSLLNAKQQDTIKALETICQKIEAPSQRFERVLHYWVAWVIIPVFILANAGIIFGEVPYLIHPLTLGIFFGLVIGKPVGIMLFSWIGVKAGITSLPRGLSWTHLLGGAALAGIGFTISIFISSLALTDEIFLSMAKFSILLASIISGTIGILILRNLEPVEEETEDFECEE